MYPKVSIIVLNWNGKKDTTECLESLKKVTYPNYEILLADNGSTDGSVEYFREAYPQVKVIENRENLGYAEGNNVAIKYALKKGTDYVLLLNNDTRVAPDFLDKLVKKSESNEKIAIVGPVVYKYDEPNKTTYIGGRVNLYTGKIKYLFLGQSDIEHLNTEVEFDYISGCSLLIKRKVIDYIEMLDPRFFLYLEDVDLCLRAKKKGYKIICVPDAKIWHKVSASVNTSYLSYYYGTRNWFLLMKKNGNLIQKLCFYPIFWMKIIVSFIKLLLRGRKTQSKVTLYAMYDILKNNYGYQKRY